MLRSRKIGRNAKNKVPIKLVKLTTRA